MQLPFSVVKVDRDRRNGMLTSCFRLVPLLFIPFTLLHRHPPLVRTPLNRLRGRYILAKRTPRRKAISIANKSGDQERINQVMADYTAQRFRPRNRLPLMRNI
jgi:hypothetical protein